ncbi:MAG: hypothetical protein ASARMPRED_004383 [Alectoria sarmentosa]|nr:MAG: hypothetical protein ASARMPRED_004383 [Alectoria sarmentosa]
MNNQLLPIIPRSENGVVTRGVRDKDDLDIAFELETSRIVAPVDVPPPNHTESLTAANLAQVDLTRSDDEDESVSSRADNDLSQPVQALAPPPGNLGLNPEAPEEHTSDFVHQRSPSNDAVSVLDSTPLEDNHETKYLAQARLQFPSARPPFARLNKNEDPKTVTIAGADGQLPKTPVLATLVVREWDSKSSYYTLDRNGERLIVKPIGGRHKHKNRGGNPYRTWCGQGNDFEHAPVAFAFKGDVEEESSERGDDEHDLESDFENVSIHDSASLGDEDYSPTNSKTSDLEGQAQQVSGSQKLTTEPAHLEPPATRRRLARLNTNHEDGETGYLKDVARNRLEPPPHAGPSKASTNALQISEVAAGKRPASDHLDDDRSSKKICPVSTNTFISSSTTARIPPTLTSDKQERTILYVLLPGSTSDVVGIKLRSTMNITTFFSSVKAAAGVLENQDVAIAVVLRGEDGGRDKTIIVRKNMIDSFECFLEVVDEATCWEEEGGRLTLQLHLRWRHMLEMDMEAG